MRLLIGAFLILSTSSLYAEQVFIMYSHGRITGIIKNAVEAAATAEKNRGNQDFIQKFQATKEEALRPAESYLPRDKITLNADITAHQISLTGTLVFMGKEYPVHYTESMELRSIVADLDAKQPITDFGAGPDLIRMIFDECAGGRLNTFFSSAEIIPDNDYILIRCALKEKTPFYTSQFKRPDEILVKRKAARNGAFAHLASETEAGFDLRMSELGFSVPDPAPTRPAYECVISPKSAETLNKMGGITVRRVIGSAELFKSGRMRSSRLYSGKPVSHLSPDFADAEAALKSGADAADTAARMIIKDAFTKGAVRGKNEYRAFKHDEIAELMKSARWEFILKKERSDKNQDLKLFLSAFTSVFPVEAAKSPAKREEPLYVVELGPVFSQQAPAGMRMSSKRAYCIISLYSKGRRISAQIYSEAGTGLSDEAAAINAMTMLGKKTAEKINSAIGSP